MGNRKYDPRLLCAARGEEEKSRRRRQMTPKLKMAQMLVDGRDSTNFLTYHQII